MEDQTFLIILGVVIGAAIWAAILNVIIAGATNAKTQLKYKEKEIKLLRLIARKLNASEEEVNEAMRD